MSVTLNFPEVQVEYKSIPKRLGFVRRDFDTVWHDFLPNGDPVVIERKSRGARNEILNGAVPGSSYGTTPGLPATEKFAGGSSVMLTKDLCYKISKANWEVSRKYIGWDLFKAEILRATRTAGFWANTVSSTTHRFEFHNGDSNGKESFGILVQPMSMSGALHSIVDMSGTDYIIEAMPPDIPDKFNSIHNYQHLWTPTTNSVRKELLDNKGNRVGFDEFYHEPLLSGNIRIPIFGTFQTSLSETGWAARVPISRMIEIDDVRFLTYYNKPWVMRDGNQPPNPFMD